MKPVPVVIPVFGRACVFETVSLLRRQSCADALRFVIVDNGNASELSARLAALAGPDCRVIRFGENRGGSAAYIAGMECAARECGDADFVWLLDDDAVPNAGTMPGLLATMERLLAENPRVASVGSAVLRARQPDVIAECGATFSPLFGHASPRLAGQSLSAVGERTFEVSYSAACSLLVNRAAVAACGFWEDVFIHFDDIEWGLRVGKAGWKNFATTASTVRHPDFRGYDESRCWMTYYDARNKYWLAAKYGPLHVLAARVKNALFDAQARLTGRLPASVGYRRLAWADYRAGVRRRRDELLPPASLGVAVAAHKPYPMPRDAAYVPLFVGAAGRDSIADADGRRMTRDDTGENISAKNANWCELTGLYWAWKNFDREALGLVHYRRHFRGRRGIATGAELSEALLGVDAVLPRRRNYFIETNYSQYAHAHHARDLDVTRQILVERHPDFVAAFDRSMKSTRGHRFNMFVMRRVPFDGYCRWLFDVLSELERRLDVSAYSAYDARVFGFVAERLLDVWIAVRGIRCRELPVLNLESQHWPRKAACFVLRKIFPFCHWR